MECVWVWVCVWGGGGGGVFLNFDDLRRHLRPNMSVKQHQRTKFKQETTVMDISFANIICDNIRQPGMILVLKLKQKYSSDKRWIKKKKKSVFFSQSQISIYRNYRS